MDRAALSMASYPMTIPFRMSGKEDFIFSPMASTAGMTATAGWDVPHRCPSSSSMEWAMIPVARAAQGAGTLLPSQRMVASSLPPVSLAYSMAMDASSPS